MDTKSSKPTIPTNTDSCTRTVDVYEKIEVIGQGTYGTVHKARSKETNEIVALKKIRMENEKEGFPITAIREIKILKELDHENVVKLKEIVTSKSAKDMSKEGSVYLVFEFMDHDLAGIMDSPVKGYIAEDAIKCYFKQLLEGLHYLHKNNILHRDIKASNLLINNQGILKLADFGLARPVSEVDHGRYTNKVITLWYRPPELLLGADQYGAAIDMWSAGCILAELLDKKALFPGHAEAEQIDLIFRVMGTPAEENWPDARKLPMWESFKPKKAYKSRLREKFKTYSNEAVDLLEQLLQLDPKKRISAIDALDHQYFWTEPLPCNPSDIPQFPSSHEFTAKKRRQKAAGDSTRACKKPRVEESKDRKDDDSYDKSRRSSFGAPANHHQHPHQLQQQQYHHQQHQNMQHHHYSQQQSGQYYQQNGSDQSYPHRNTTSNTYGGAPPPQHHQHSRQGPPPPRPSYSGRQGGQQQFNNSFNGTAGTTGTTGNGWNSKNAYPPAPRGVAPQQYSQQPQLPQNGGYSY